MAAPELLKLLAPSPKVRLIVEGICFVLCMLLTIAQLGILDYFFVHYTHKFVWLAWIAGDLLVLAAMLVLLYFSITYNLRCFHNNCGDDANLRFAWLAWLIYSIVLSGKIAASAVVYMRQLTDEELLGQNSFQMVLSLSAIIFLLLVLSHHYTKLDSFRQTYLSYLETAVTLDILDSISFLNLLFDPFVKPHLSNAYEISILFFACFNFVIPTFALVRLRYRTLPKWSPFAFREIYTLMYFLFVNVPYLVIRSLLWSKIDGHGASVFLVKNVIMIFLGLRELYMAWLKHKHSGMVSQGLDRKICNC